MVPFNKPSFFFFFFKAFPYFLILQDAKAHPVFILSQPWYQPLLGGLVPLLERAVYRDRDLGARCSHCYWSHCFQDSQPRQAGNKLVYQPMHLQLSVFLYFSVTDLKPSIHTDTSDPKLKPWDSF